MQAEITFDKAFLNSDFDPGQYVNSLIKTNDISTNLSKLTFDISHIQKSIQEQVTDNHETLLDRIHSLAELETQVTSLKSGVGHLSHSVDEYAS